MLYRNATSKGLVLSVCTIAYPFAPRKSSVPPTTISSLMSSGPPTNPWNVRVPLWAAFLLKTIVEVSWMPCSPWRSVIGPYPRSLPSKRVVLSGPSRTSLSNTRKLPNPMLVRSFFPVPAAARSVADECGARIWWTNTVSLDSFGAETREYPSFASAHDATATSATAPTCWPDISPSVSKLPECVMEMCKVRKYHEIPQFVEKETKDFSKYKSQTNLPKPTRAQHAKL